MTNSLISVTVPAGEIIATVSVQTTDDTIDELDETFIIANGNATAVGTILDNDDSPEIAIKNF
jgi:hypothetical protein